MTDNFFCQVKEIPSMLLPPKDPDTRRRPVGLYFKIHKAPGGVNQVGSNKSRMMINYSIHTWSFQLLVEDDKSQKQIVFFSQKDPVEIFQQIYFSM